MLHQLIISYFCPGWNCYIIRQGVSHTFSVKKSPCMCSYFRLKLEPEILNCQILTCCRILHRSCNQVQRRGNTRRFQGGHACAHSIYTLVYLNLSFSRYIFACTHTAPTQHEQARDTTVKCWPCNLFPHTHPSIQTKHVLVAITGTQTG